MYRLTTMSSSTQRHQRGITLIESLIAILVTALGILGILGVQMRTLTDTQTTVRRAQAIRLIEDLSERLKVHPNALLSLGSYASAWSTPSSTPGAPATNCATTACNATQLTTYDVAEWIRDVQRILPVGDATIFLAPGDDAANPRQLGVMVRWRENERPPNADDTSYKKNIDATQVRATDGTLSAGGGAAATCTDGFTCHLQYIPVSARCAPYDMGGGVKQSYCPGA